MAAGDGKERDSPAAKKKLNPGSSFAGAGKDVYGRSHREQRRAKDRLNKPGMRIGRDRRLNHGVKTVHSGCHCRSPTPLPGSQRKTPESRRHQSRPTWRRARTLGKSQPCPPWSVPERHGGLVHERRSCSPHDDGDRPRPGRRPTGIPGRVSRNICCFLNTNPLTQSSPPRSGCNAPLGPIGGQVLLSGF